MKEQPLRSLSFAKGDHIKHLPKMLAVENNITNFLERPFDSMKNPLVIHPKVGAVPTSPLEDFSLRINQGGCKNFVIKTIIVACNDLELTDAELLCFLPQLLALFEIRALCSGAGSHHPNPGMSSPMLPQSLIIPTSCHQVGTFAQACASHTSQMNPHMCRRQHKSGTEAPYRTPKTEFAFPQAPDKSHCNKIHDVGSLRLFIDEKPGTF